MEEWHATIEREITARMPFPTKAVEEAYHTDRRWNGLGVYGDYGRRAVSKLREEYVRDQDLVAFRNHVDPLQIGPEGLHVRVRPGTRGIPEHLYGCPITVEYVDPPSRAEVEAAWGEVGPIVDRLWREQPSCLLMSGTGHIQLEAWAVPVAEDLHPAVRGPGGTDGWGTALPAHRTAASPAPSGRYRSTARAAYPR
jgi:hypothetical protein